MLGSIGRASLSATASFIALSVSVPAAAQSGPEPAATIDDIIVTAQKREESIQDVPIAVSAFSAENLDAMKIEGGSELLRAVPNVAFSKNNFSMYNFSIRGIGTKAVAASSDPAVAVSFNNAPMIRNRLFEAEYLDVARVEVLRGPQGTLYGRNATAGVVNMIPNLPGDELEAMLKVEGGNFGSVRGQMMLNLPLSDTFAVRGAASFTKRDGFDHNLYDDTSVNGRDLHSVRLSAAWAPTDNFNASFVWERFGEDDDRSRTGKQLCTRDPGATSVGGSAIVDSLTQNRLSQGCLPGSLYDDAAYGTPNGGAFGHYFVAGMTHMGFALDGPNQGQPVYAVDNTIDPYLGIVQSRNLREIDSPYKPRFRATNDIFQFNMEWNGDNGISLVSQTTYTKDEYWSTQDYSRYVSNPVFADSFTLGGVVPYENPNPPLANGIYVDPQLGPSSRILSADLSTSDNRQWTQEFRIQSAYDGRFNFNVGVNYIDFKTEDNYYVFNNLFNLITEYYYNRYNAPGNFGPQTRDCGEIDNPLRECIYVDRSAISDLEGDGHNYFRSRNPVAITSTGIFGEVYLDMTDSLRLTAGLRYTMDEKVTTPVPSQLLLGALENGGPGWLSGGFYQRGYPEQPDIKQEWEATTGRLVLDWRPVLSFTDDTLFYASYSRGYKGGGVNPPRVDLNPEVIQYLPLAEVFEPEYVNAFEIGTKNSFAGGRGSLNLTAFYYDYKDYQVSQIVDRISLNENFDAEIWGLELEAAFRPTPNWRIDGNIGYLQTRVGDGESSIDVMNRTQGDAEWTLLRPWVQVPSNCIAPTRLAKLMVDLNAGETTMWGLQALCAGSARFGSWTPEIESTIPFWAFLGETYNPLTDAPNFGRGIAADLSGNNLPNSPELTANIGSQYTFYGSGWDVTVRGDYYWQSDSYFRVYNTEYDRIRAWDNLNLSITVVNAARDLELGIYVKNVLDETPIVDAFTNSDDTGLTTNVFTLDPRLVGVSLKKRF